MIFPEDGNHVQLNIDDYGNDNDDDNDDFLRGPPSLQGVTLEPLNLPAPDLSTVIQEERTTPIVTPIPTPARRESIVSVSGLSMETENKEIANAIEILRRNMCDDNSSPSALDTVQDVEEYNNTLVLSLPQRRKSLSSPFGSQSPVPPAYSPARTEPSFIGKNKQSSTESDEGIGMVEEEIIEKSVYIPCSGAPPPNSGSLLISMPNGSVTFSEEESFHKTNSESRRGSQSDVIRDGEVDPGRVNGQRKDSFGVRSDRETPRSHRWSFSEFSCHHMSLTSPRSEMSLSEDDEESDEDRLIYHISQARAGEIPSRPVISARRQNSQVQSDADLVLSNMRDNDTVSYESQSESNRQLDDEVVGEGDKSAANTSRESPRKKKQNPNKRLLPVETIELKELKLNAPVTADQFSNRHKFGAVPRTCSKFLVLGKTPGNKFEDSAQDVNVKPLVRHNSRPLLNGRAGMITPTLKLDGTRRPLTAAVTSRERTVLQQRRICLLAEERSPLTDEQRNFDVLVPSDSIQIPTAKPASDQDMLERIKQMEKKILNRCTSTSQDIDFEPPNSGSQTHRPEASLQHTRSLAGRRPMSAVAGPVKDQRLSVIDLSKSLRKDSHVRSNASLNKKHSGLKSMVPLARVLMAYQSSRRKRQQCKEFSSISRRLERGGVPFSHSSTENQQSAYSVSNIDQSKVDKKKKRNKRAKKILTARDIDFSEDNLVVPPDEEVATLIGDLKEDNVVTPKNGLYDRVRVLSAPSSGRSELPMAGIRSGHLGQFGGQSSSTQSSVVTLEIPRDYNRRKSNRVSMLNKLSVK